MRRVALVTSNRHPGLIADDQPLVPALAAEGYEAHAVAWDDPAHDWPGDDAIVIRSPWDYYLRTGEFRAWLERLRDAGAALWNPADIALWNLDKRYLLELAGKGADVVPTLLVEGRAADAAGEAAARGWTEVVVKPVVSAGAHRTHRLRVADIPARAAALDAEYEGDAMLVQPFLPEIETEGELSFVFFDGRCSHAARKNAAKGDFRVQEKHGGMSVRHEPRAWEVAAAQRILDRAPGPLLYARVDMVPVGGRLLLVELEILEPELFFRLEPAAPGRYARALARLA